MSGGTVHLSPATLEHHEAREIVRDEDVLSLELQTELESVGTALGLIAAFALVASQIVRAGRLVRRITLAPSTARGSAAARSDASQRAEVRDDE